MSHAVELPLAIDPLASAQAKTIQAFVVAQVAEYRLHRGEAPGDHRAAEFTVDAALHADQGVVRLGFRQEESHLPRSSFLRSAQALPALQATQAVAQRAFELDCRLALEVRRKLQEEITNKLQDIDGVKVSVLPEATL